MGSLVEKINDKYYPGGSGDRCESVNPEHKCWAVQNDSITNSIKMRVFKFYSGDVYWAYSSEDKEAAKEQFFLEQGEIPIDAIEEMPESTWDERIINIWVDNDFSTEPFKSSIREQLNGDIPQLLFSNDHSTF